MSKTQTIGNSDLIAELKREIRNTIAQEMKEITKEMKKTNENVSELKKSVEFFSAKIDEYNKEPGEYKSDHSTLKKENEILKTKLSEMEKELTELQQYGRLKKLEIHGIPVTKNENIEEIIGKTAKVLNIGNNDERLGIEAAHRLPTRDKKKIPSIIVAFSSRKTRDNWIMNYKAYQKEMRQNDPHVFKGLRTTHINKNLEDGPVYINENLTPRLRQIFNETRLAAKKNNFKFTWIKTGKIFVKKNEASRTIRIHNIQSLKELSIDNTEETTADDKEASG
ncbi:uncharacterized protein LOC120350206 [Nilaparvata lugens]|uniref:uncharacterized protein LOC120350206 n=1 Tax=Nilaparvata lugens TaxID=108931 RepID=UPI00193CACE0|nr:uncharacterized protein LOC120350206 [Nilaparvata lugens]